MLPLYSTAGCTLTFFSKAAASSVSALVCTFSISSSVRSWSMASSWALTFVSRLLRSEERLSTWGQQAHTGTVEAAVLSPMQSFSGYLVWHSLNGIMHECSHNTLCTTSRFKIFGFIRISPAILHHLDLPCPVEFSESLFAPPPVLRLSSSAVQSSPSPPPAPPL